MDSHDILVELLAIKLHEHTPLASGARQMTDWSEVDPADRQDFRNRIIKAAKPEALYEE